MAGITLLGTLVSLLATVHSACGAGPYAGQIKNLVTFGDSYSDVAVPGDNATAWPIFAAEDGDFTLYPFARSGATCSNYLTYKPFPSVFESQLPTYFAEVANGTLHLDPEDTVYTLWIGTNDVGVDALITGGQTPGVTLVNTTDCAINWVRVLYASGARNFVFQNMLPLQDTILYSIDSYPNRYWTEQRNSTDWHVFMTELTNTANNLNELKLQALLPYLPGAHVGLFNSYQLISDIISTPQYFLNGTAPYNVTGCINSCVFALNESTAGPADCYVTNGTARDSFLWYDELHPSEQTDRVIGREIAASIKNAPPSEYITWFT